MFIARKKYLNDIESLKLAMDKQHYISNFERNKYLLNDDIHYVQMNEENGWKNIYYLEVRVSSIRNGYWSTTSHRITDIFDSIDELNKYIFENHIQINNKSKQIRRKSTKEEE